MAPLPINAVLFVVVFLALGAGRGMAQLVISGNENKIDLTSGGPKVIRPGASDSISILDFAKFPPTVEHLLDVPNSVVGPPSNIAITRDRKVALIANSLKIDPANPTNWVPEDFVYVVDLASKPPRVVEEITVRKTVTVCLPAESPSDVAIAPDGKLALVSAWKGGYIAVLKIDGENITATGQKISTYGQPYRVVITPDGELALTAGMGFGNGLDRDAVTVIDLHSKPIRAIQHVTIGSVPESIEISPDGKLLAAVVMNGSNLAATDPNHSEHGGVLLLARKGKTFHVVEELPIGRIPEGVAFTPDGKYLVVQCHPDRELWIFSVNGGRLRDTGQRIKVPGMPSSLRASP